MPGLFEEFIPEDPLMAQAWVDCLRWSITEPKMLDAFREQTGFTWQPGGTPLERMIDQATGLEKVIVRQYVQWFNDNVWGHA